MRLPQRRLPSPDGPRACRSDGPAPRGSAFAARVLHPPPSMASPDPSRASAGRPLTASIGELAGTEDLESLSSGDDDAGRDLEPLPSFELPTDRRVITAAQLAQIAAAAGAEASTAPRPCETQARRRPRRFGGLSPHARRRRHDEGFQSVTPSDRHPPHLSRRDLRAGDARRAGAGPHRAARRNFPRRCRLLQSMSPDRRAPPVLHTRGRQRRRRRKGTRTRSS